MKTEAALKRLRLAVHRRLSGVGADVIADDEIDQLLDQYDDMTVEAKIDRMKRRRKLWWIFRPNRTESS